MHAATVARAAQRPCEVRGIPVTFYGGAILGNLINQKNRQNLDHFSSWPNNGSAEAAESHRPLQGAAKTSSGNASIPFRRAGPF